MDIIDKDYGDSCPPCTPEPFAVDKTPQFINVTFSGIDGCDDLPEGKIPPDRSFLCEQTGVCLWGYAGYDYQVEVWAQPAGTTISAFDENAVIQYFRGVVWGECAFDMDNTQTCEAFDLTENGSAVGNPAHGPPLEIAYTFGIAPVVGIRFARTELADDIDMYFLQNHKYSINLLVKYDTKY